MKILIAPDSFKESLSAWDVAQHIKTGWQQAMPDATVVCQPMADGGEGTLDVLVRVMQGEIMQSVVQDGIGRPITASWGWIQSSQLAIIEMAQAAGIEHVAAEDRDIMNASSFGVGELIKHALDNGAKELLVTLGGSVTNDAGWGILAALGAQFFDVDNQPMQPGAIDLQRLSRISLDQMDSRLNGVVWNVACDVTNPLCGENGASAVFGPQKGATAEQVMLLDQALMHFATTCYDQLGYELRHVAGGGAAGGIAATLYGFFQASLVSGADLVMQYSSFQNALADVDLVITGEGRIDQQSTQGKVPWKVACAAAEHNIPVIILCGTLGEGYDAFYEKDNIIYIGSIVNAPMSLTKALAQCGRLLQESAYAVGRLWGKASI